MALKPTARRENKPRPQHKLKTTERGYGWDHQKLRRAIGFTQHGIPLCADCEANGMTTPATDMHHIVPINIDPTKRLDPDNVVPLCESCHDKRHGNH